MPETIATIFRDYEIDGVPASGPAKPEKRDIRATLGAMESAVNSFLANGGLVYLTRATLLADLAHAANTSAWVISDTTIAYNGIYQKSGGSGSGTWTRIADLPFSFVRATDAGAGTPNAIAATSFLPVSDGVLVAFVVFDTNTAAPVTVAFNGDTALTIKTASGNNVAAGGLVAGTAIVGYRSGATLRLLTDQASAAIQAAAELAQAAAEAARAAADADRISAAASAAAARAAAEASGPINFYDTKAAANAALAGLANLAVVEVFVDESRGGTRTLYRKESGVYVYKITLPFEDKVSPEQFGGTNADVTAGWQAALDYLTSIGGGTCRINKGTWAITSQVIGTGNNITIELDDAATIDHTALAAAYATNAALPLAPGLTNKYSALLLLGSNCTVRGGGRFLGPAAWNPGSGSSNVSPAVILINGDHGTVDDRVRITNVYRIGIAFVDCNHGQVRNCYIDGNQPSPTFPLTTTVHFGVHFDPGTEGSYGNFKLLNNTIKNCIQGCSISNYGSGGDGSGMTHGCVVLGNIFQGIWDHCIYSNYTDGLTITGNNCSGCHTAIVCSGPRNVVTGNAITTLTPGGSSELDVAGINMRDAAFCIVSSNILFGSLTSNSPVCIDVSSFGSAVEGNLITNNTIRTVGRGTAIRVTTRGLAVTVIDNIIKGNRIVSEGASGLGIIEIEGNPGGGNYGNMVTGNRIAILNTGAHGIVLQYGESCHITNNIASIEYNAVSSTGTDGIWLFSCTDTKSSGNLFSVRTGFGANVTAVGFKETGGTSAGNETRFDRMSITSTASGFSAFSISPEPSPTVPLLIFADVSGAPAFSCRVGSQCSRSDGGTGTSFYVNEANGNHWVAK